MIPAHHSPNLFRRSATVVSWLTETRHEPLAPVVASWEEDDWAAARWAVQVHGIGPLLHHAAADWPDADALHPRLRNYLAAQHRLSAERVAILLRDLSEILRACQDHGMPVLPLKGSLLTTTYYPAPGLRPMSDLDLLVRPADEPRMLTLLAKLGYQVRARGWKHIMLAQPEAYGRVVSYEGEHPDNPRSLDLHVRLCEQFWGIHYDLTDDVWADSASGDFLGTETRILGPTALLHHLAIHASSDMIARRVRLLHLHDIALVAPALDCSGWDHIVASAKARKEERLLYPALALTRRYYPVIPEDVLARLRVGVPTALLTYLHANTIDALSFCNPTPTTPVEKLCWFRPGREQVAALRHMLLPDRKEMGHWYPRLSGAALLPLAYARYGFELGGWAIRRTLGQSRRMLNALPRQD